jgi:signal transduction histidine kinase
VTIARRLAIGYAWMSAACLVLVAWLGYHVFVQEPVELAAMGLRGIERSIGAELSAACFLGAVPVLLGIGWWRMRRVLAPLKALALAVERVHSHDLRQSLPRSMNGDEVDILAAALNSMTARLDESFRRIHEFTLHASHELKTPLTVMRGQLEMALREPASLAPEQGEWFDGQLDEVKRLTQIVDVLTLLTKADAGLVEVERQPVQLGELVEEAFEDALILARPYGVRVTLAECEQAVVIGDRHRLRQVLLILTDNAVKFNHPGGAISISLRRVAETAELRITNTDGGIAPKTLEHVFGRFVRGENARGKVEGSGLGLTIAQWIVHAHAGGIQLIAEPDEKIAVVVKIPAVAAAVPAVAPAPSPSAVA